MIEYVVIAGYLAFLVAIGVVFRRFNRNVSDYFRAGCRGTWWLVGASAFMNAFSAWTFTGAAGSAFECGWSISVIFLGNVFAFALHAAWLAPWFRQLRAVTSPEIIRLRFGPVTQQLYAWLYAVLGLLYASVWLSVGLHRQRVRAGRAGCRARLERSVVRDHRSRPRRAGVLGPGRELGRHGH